MITRLKVGLVGRGGGFFGKVHERAAGLAGMQVSAIVPSSDPAKAFEYSQQLPKDIEVYGDYQKLLEHQNTLEEDRRIDFVVIATPNHLHFEQSKMALEAGFPVLCEKPLCFTVAEGLELERIAQEQGLPFAVAYTYIGHWTSKLAGCIIRNNHLGEVRSVTSTYFQGWLATDLENQPDTPGHKQAVWRVDPQYAGISCCGGDIGTHALMQLRYVTGLEIDEVRAHLKTHVPGRKLDDEFYTHCTLRGSGAAAIIHASQVEVGADNDLGIKVVCERGTLVWKQEDSEHLIISRLGKTKEIITRGNVRNGTTSLCANLPKKLLNSITLPAGHCEGFHDALANIYRGFGEKVNIWKAYEPYDEDGEDYATLNDGINGIRFLEAAVNSSKTGAWVKMK